MLELLVKVAEAATQTSVAFYVIMWVVLLMVNYAYYHK